MTDVEIEGEGPDPFEPWTVDVATMRILLAAAGWGWDYWGKFYSPQGDKYRDPRWVLESVKNNWKCPDCDCDPGCPCCGPHACGDDGNPYAGPHVPYRALHS